MAEEAAGRHQVLANKTVNASESESAGSNRSCFVVATFEPRPSGIDASVGSSISNMTSDVAPCENLGAARATSTTSANRNPVYPGCACRPQSRCAAASAFADSGFGCGCRPVRDACHLEWLSFPESSSSFRKKRETNRSSSQSR